MPVQYLAREGGRQIIAQGGGVRSTPQPWVHCRLCDEQAKPATESEQETELCRSLRELVDYWASGYDWRKAEAKLNALPQYLTNIDGLDIHFIHVRSKHSNALPLIVTHGWPGSIIEQLKITQCF